MEASGIANRIKDVWKSANSLEKLLERQRRAELAADIKYSLGGQISIPGAHQPPLFDKLEADRGEEAETEAGRINAKYDPLEQAIAAHVQGLASFKSEIEDMLQKENNRAFWNGFWMNALFFVLGLASSAIPLPVNQLFEWFRGR